METSTQIDELATALAKAQSKFPNIGRSETVDNGKYSYTYATLASVLDAVRADLADNGLSIWQSPGSGENGRVTMTLMLMHSSGQFLKDTFSMPVTQNTPQGIGSIISYARRYQLLSCLGLATDDDDAQQAEKEHHENTQYQPKRIENRATIPAQEAKPALQVVEGQTVAQAQAAFQARAESLGFESQGQKSLVGRLAVLCLKGKPAKWDVDAWQRANSISADAMIGYIEYLKKELSEECDQLFPTPPAPVADHTAEAIAR